jgi:hypothetical protein
MGPSFRPALEHIGTRSCRHVFQRRAVAEDPAQCFCPANRQKSKKPTPGLEPGTPSLRGKCSSRRLTQRRPLAGAPTGARREKYLQMGTCLTASKAVRGHWPLEGSNPSPSAFAQKPFSSSEFPGCLGSMATYALLSALSTMAPRLLTDEANAAAVTGDRRSGRGEPQTLDLVRNSLLSSPMTARRSRCRRRQGV